MMFQEYLAEAKKEYTFKIYIAGELPENFAETVETAMQKFKLTNMTPAKKAPISQKPLYFPQLQNLETHCFEVSCEYPTTEHVLQNYISEYCGCDHAHLVVKNANAPQEEMQDEQMGPNEPYETILDKEDMGQAVANAQDTVGTDRVMNLLKELEKSLGEREIDPIAGVKAADQKQQDEKINTSSPIGSK